MLFSRLCRSARDDANAFILPVEEQVNAWRKANRRMKWGIGEEAFAAIGSAPPFSSTDRADGFIGAVLSYGFGADGAGGADAVLSGHRAWDYACRQRRRKVWQCQYIHFDKTDCFRLRPAAPIRPKGFYFAKFRPGDAFRHLTVAQYLKMLAGDTGCGPEGVQLLTITHPHVAELMNRRRIAFMAFADYDLAPYGFNDFFDTLQMFCSNAILGLGIGNVDQNYPGFGIPSLRFL